MSRFKSYDEYALQQMAGRPMASQGLDFAAHAPRSPFGGQTPFSPFQAGGGQGQSPQGLVGRAGQGGPQFQTRTSDGHSFVSRVGGGGMNAFGNGRSDLQYGNRAGGGEANGWEMSRDAMLSDMSNIQGAGDRMFDRLQGNNQGMSDLVGGSSPSRSPRPLQPGCRTGGRSGRCRRRSCRPRPPATRRSARRRCGSGTEGPPAPPCPRGPEGSAPGPLQPGRGRRGSGRRRASGERGRRNPGPGKPSGAPPSAGGRTRHSS
jgi:hypothetical protein